MTKTEKLLELAKRIVETEKQLAFLRSEFSRLAGDPALPLTKRRSSAPLTERVRLALAARAPETVTAQVLAADVGESLESVRAALSKLCRQGTAERVDRGLYAATKLPDPDPETRPE